MSGNRPGTLETRMDTGCSRCSHCSQSKSIVCNSYPTFETWTAAEIDAFAVRVELLARCGQRPRQAEALATRLLQRDRDQDERRLCLECRFFLRGRCTNWRAAGMAGRRYSDLGRRYPLMLKRCPGFEPVIPPACQDNAP